MPYIIEMKGMRLGIRDEECPTYDALEEFFKKVRRRFRNATMWYHGLQGLVYSPCIEMPNRQLGDFKRLLRQLTTVASFKWKKRGRKIVHASAVTEDFEIAYEEDGKITISTVKPVSLEVLAPEPL